eukprot:g15617.t1
MTVVSPVCVPPGGRTIWRETFGEEMPAEVAAGSWIDMDSIRDKEMREELVSSIAPSTLLWSALSEWVTAETRGVCRAGRSAAAKAQAAAAAAAVAATPAVTAEKNGGGKSAALGGVVLSSLSRNAGNKFVRTLPQQGCLSSYANVADSRKQLPPELTCCTGRTQDEAVVAVRTFVLYLGLGYIQSLQLTSNMDTVVHAVCPENRRSPHVLKSPIRGPILVATSCHPWGGLYEAIVSQCGAGPGKEVRVTHRHRIRYVTDL